jgi:hypothetical protein
MAGLPKLSAAAAERAQFHIKTGAHSGTLIEAVLARAPARARANESSGRYGPVCHPKVLQEQQRPSS